MWQFIKSTFGEEGGETQSNGGSSNAPSSTTGSTGSRPLSSHSRVGNATPPPPPDVASTSSAPPPPQRQGSSSSSARGAPPTSITLGPPPPTSVSAALAGVRYEMGFPTFSQMAKTSEEQKRLQNSIRQVAQDRIRDEQLRLRQREVENLERMIADLQTDIRQQPLQPSASSSGDIIEEVDITADD